MVHQRILPAEHLRPQLFRERWQNLNGWWEFEIDHGRSGKDRKFYERKELSGKIWYPSAPKASCLGWSIGILWRRCGIAWEFELPPGWGEGNRVLLHFEAVDYYTEVWINGVSVGSHRGGFTPFTFDITDHLVAARMCYGLC